MRTRGTITSLSSRSLSRRGLARKTYFRRPTRAYAPTAIARRGERQVRAAAAAAYTTHRKVVILVHEMRHTHKFPLRLALLALGPRRSSISSDAVHEIPEVVDHLEVRVAAALHLERAHAPSARRASSDPALDVGARVVPFDRRDVGVQADRVLCTLDLVDLACRRRRGVRESVATTVSGARWGLKMGWHVAHVA